MKIRISAYDMLFFGTGRPFSMEDESWTKGVFPPFPSTIYGYLRSIYFEKSMSSLKNANKANDPTANFTINTISISLIKEEKEIQLYPIPFGHVLHTDENENKQIVKLDLEKPKFISNNPFEYVLISNLEGKLETLNNDYYISKSQLENYLSGKKINEQECYKITNYITPEERIGIAKDLKLGKVADGKLYRIQFNNLKQVDFKEKTASEILFKLDIDADLTPKALRTLGGEGKKAILDNCEIKAVQVPKKQNLKAVIYFTTPALFELEIFKDYAAIQFIANDTPIAIGGWDIEKRLPKPLKQMYPAGTVLYIKFKDDESINKFTLKYNNKLGELTKQGFGQFYLGNQNNN